ncbi:MAG: cytochrome c1 [Burkholderiaceae bacterium]|nr:cytochrome c1 [Burkholderiaceae bacterium]
MTLLVALGVSGANAAGGGYPLERFPVEKLTDQAALQNGAKLFVNYCLGCHGASSMRYNRLRDIGLSEEQIKGNLLFTGEKVGSQMMIAMRASEAKEWFGAAPPDLSVIARARSSGEGSGGDWLYTYLRAYYRDASREIGWNNALFENVGMPNPFWEIQGSRGASIEEVRAVKDEKSGKLAGYERHTVSFDAEGVRSDATARLEGSSHHASRKIVLGKPQDGTLEGARFDAEMADLVAFLAYVSDPTARERTRLGVWVLLFLAIFTAFAWWLNREYWKDIK